MADAPKTPQPAPVDENSIFVRNPGGAVYDVEPTHPSVALAAKGAEGWRFASADEINKFCATHNLEGADTKAHASKAAALRKAAEVPSAEQPPAPSAEEAGLEPVEKPAKETPAKK